MNSCFKRTLSAHKRCKCSCKIHSKSSQVHVHKSCCSSCQFWVVSIKLECSDSCKSITNRTGFASEPYICSVDIPFHEKWKQGIYHCNHRQPFDPFGRWKISIFHLGFECLTLIVRRKKERLCPLLRPTEMCPHADKHFWTESQSLDTDLEWLIGWVMIMK